MTDSLPTDEYVSIIPGQTADHVGRMVAERVFQKHGSPNSLYMDMDGMAKVCALAAQTVINGVTGEWQ